MLLLHNLRLMLQRVGFLRSLLTLALLAFFVSRAVGEDQWRITSPTVAITLRPSEPGIPNYPLLPFDVTIDVRNITAMPRASAAFLFSSVGYERLQLSPSTLWRIWSVESSERRIGFPPLHGLYLLPHGPDCRVIGPDETHSVRQIIRQLRYHALYEEPPKQPWWHIESPEERLQRRPLVDEVFVFPRLGTYTMQMELGDTKVRSNRLEIVAAEPEGRDREAYEYLRSECKWPFFVSGQTAYPGHPYLKAVEEFLARFPDTVYSPYARYCLSIRQSRQAMNDLATSGIVTDDSFLALWDELLADKDFRLWPWVMKRKADYLERLGTRRRMRGPDTPRTGRLIYLPVVRMGQTLTREQQQAIGEESRRLRETLQKIYPYLPDD